MSRDRPTVALYGLFGTWGWFIFVFPPAAALIGAELGLTKAQAGLHGTAMAAGTIVTGTLIARVVARWGRFRTLLGGVTVLMLGAGSLPVAPSLPFTLVSAFCAGLGLSCALACAQPALAIQQGGAASAALTEANAVGAFAGVGGPLVLGTCVAVGLGWRPAIAVTVVLAAATILALRPHRAAPAFAFRPPPAAAGGAAVSLGWRFRVRWPMVILAVGLEVGTAFWAPALLQDTVALPASVATAAVGGMVAGMFVSRVAVAGVSTRVRPDAVIVGAVLLSALGWLVLWTAVVPVQAMAGLVVCGLGFGALYPLAVAMTLAAGARQIDRAQGWVSLGVGVAIACTPLLLGSLADRVGVHRGFLLIPVLLTAVVVCVLMARLVEGRASLDDLGAERAQLRGVRHACPPGRIVGGRTWGRREWTR